MGDEIVKIISVVLLESSKKGREEKERERGVTRVKSRPDLPGLNNKEYW